MTIATFITLPFFQDAAVQKIFATLIKISSMFIIFTELVELLAAPIPMWRTRLCVMAVVSQLLYFWAADSSKLFNRGEIFILGSLCYSLAEELKVLALVL
jgi:hypothetical protein